MFFALQEVIDCFVASTMSNNIYFLSAAAFEKNDSLIYKGKNNKISLNFVI